MTWSVDIVQPASTRDLLAVQELWAEYWKSLGLSLDFQGFAEELRTLPGKYAPPAGGLFLARIEGQPAGTAAFRHLRQGACEAKRLFVRPAWRRQGVAGSLLAKLIEEARFAGYRNLYGDTLTNMAPAIDLYRGMGFVEVGPYSEEPTAGAIYLRLTL